MMKKYLVVEDGESIWNGHNEFLFDTLKEAEEALLLDTEDLDLTDVKIFEINLTAPVSTATAKTVFERAEKPQPVKKTKAAPKFKSKRRKRVQLTPEKQGLVLQFVKEGNSINAAAKKFKIGWLAANKIVESGTTA